MAKKSAKEASSLFHNIMAASVKSNLKSKEQKERNNYSLPIADLEIPSRLKNILKKNEVETLKQLASYEAIEVLQFKNVGINSITLLENILAKYSLKFGDFKK